MCVSKEIVVGSGPGAFPPIDDLTLEGAGAARTRWLDLFSDHVYGRTPRVAWTETARAVGEAVTVGGGLGIRRAFEITVSDGTEERRLGVLLVLPATPPAERTPVVAALNFSGNDAVLSDPDGWPIDALLEAGFGLATVHAEDIEPDADGRADDGIRGLEHDAPEHPWGTLGAWAWGLSCLRRFLAGLDEVRADAIVALGHSRMGKAALWAAAQDEGFAAVVSNGSGCGGASLTRHLAGEGVADITGRFPHWFTPRFAGYAGREDELPVDQHQLLAAVAPRALYVASATEDAWADPLGEYLATDAALPAHRLHGAPRVGYHLRPGGHELGREDWEHMLAFLSRHVAPVRA